MSNGVGYIFGSLGATGKTSLLSRLSGYTLYDKIVANALFPWKNAEWIGADEGQSFEGYTATNHPCLKAGNVAELVKAFAAEDITIRPFKAGESSQHLGKFGRVNNGVITSILTDDGFDEYMADLYWIDCGPKASRMAIQFIARLKFDDGICNFCEIWFPVPEVQKIKFERFPAIELEGRGELAMAFVSPNVDVGRPRLAARIVDHEQKRLCLLGQSVVRLIKHITVNSSFDEETSPTWTCVFGDGSSSEFTNAELADALEQRLLLNIDEFENSDAKVSEIGEGLADWLRAYCTEEMADSLDKPLDSAVDLEVLRNESWAFDVERWLCDYLTEKPFRNWSPYLVRGFWTYKEVKDAIKDEKGSSFKDFVRLYNAAVTACPPSWHGQLVFEDERTAFDVLRAAFAVEIFKHSARGILTKVKGRYERLYLCLKMAVDAFRSSLEQVSTSTLAHESQVHVRGYEAKKRATEFVIVDDGAVTSFTAKPYDVQLGIGGFFWVDSINSLTFKLGGHALPGGVLAELVDWRVNNLRGHGIITYAPSTLANPLRANLNSFNRREWFDESLVNGQLAVSFKPPAASLHPCVELDESDLETAVNFKEFSGVGKVVMTSPHTFVEGELWPVNSTPRAQPVALWVTSRTTNRNKWHLIALDLAAYGYERVTEDSGVLFFGSKLGSGPTLEGGFDE